MIKIALTDADGCLTDGGVYYGIHREKVKKFDMQDGMGTRLLRESGVVTGIISSDDSLSTKYRAEDLKMDIIKIRVKSKIETLDEIVKKYNVKYEEIAFMGDDVLDIEVMKKVGLSFAPANAVSEVKQVAKYILGQSGGNGAYREYAEYILNHNKEAKE
jgi:N-acylneuraminate cytidylyltransferase